VSVVLPTYNRGALLREAVDSIVAQTWTDWELLIADDGSTDGSLEYPRSLGDRRIRILSLSHSGNPATARNAAIAAATGEWIAFVDSDDRWLPRKLEVQLAAVQASAGAAWSCTGFGHIDAEGNPTHQRAGIAYQPRSGWILAQLIDGEAVAAIATLLVRRSVLHAVGGFDEGVPFREDYDLALRLAERGEILAVGEPLSLVREHPRRATKTEPLAELFERTATIYKNAEARVSDPALRMVCRRRRADYLVDAARARSKSGEHGQAFFAIMAAARCAPTSLAVWRVTGGSVLRALRSMI
jgi:glycosyltransferase involved in cell wall biosynthesis